MDRIEPHDTLNDVRDFLRTLPNGEFHDLARKVTAPLYAERSKPARDAEGWCDVRQAWETALRDMGQWTEAADPVRRPGQGGDRDD